MSSYVAVLGIPSGDTCSIFGLTPQEVRYLQVSAYANAYMNRLNTLREDFPLLYSISCLDMKLDI